MEKTDPVQSKPKAKGKTKMKPDFKCGCRPLLTSTPDIVVKGDPGQDSVQDIFTETHADRKSVMPSSSNLKPLTSHKNVRISLDTFNPDAKLTPLMLKKKPTAIPEITLDVQLIVGDDETPVNMEFTIMMPPPPKVSSKVLPEIKLSTDSFSGITMDETSLRVAPKEVPPQYVATKMPLDDSLNSSLVEVNAGGRRYSNKPLLDQILKAKQAGGTGMQPKKSPETMDMHWGIDLPLSDEDDELDDFSGHGLHKQFATSHLNRQSAASTSYYNPSLTSVQTRVIFQVQSNTGATEFMNAQTSTMMNNQLAFQMRLASDPDDADGGLESNDLNIMLQYEPVMPDVHSYLDPGVTQTPKLSDSHQSVHVATVEMKESQKGMENSVMYREGASDKEKSLTTGGSPLKISVPVGKKVSTPVIRSARITIRNDTAESPPIPLLLRQGGEPVQMALPVGRDGRGIGLTANIVSGARPTEKTAVKCTILKDGVPGKTFTSELKRTGSPFYFDVPMADGPVRAKLTMVPLEEGQGKDSTQQQTVSSYRNPNHANKIDSYTRRKMSREGGGEEVARRPAPPVVRAPTNRKCSVWHSDSFECELCCTVCNSHDPGARTTKPILTRRSSDPQVMRQLMDKARQDWRLHQEQESKVSSLTATMQLASVSQTPYVSDMDPAFRIPTSAVAVRDGGAPQTPVVPCRCSKKVKALQQLKEMEARRDGPS